MVHAGHGVADVGNVDATSAFGASAAVMVPRALDVAIGQW
jgi:hypothetical protein